MKRIFLSLFILLFGLAIGGVGTWLYVKKLSAISYQPSAEAQKDKKILFYRHPMNPQVTSPTPQKDEMGMDYVPVYEEEKQAKRERKILFYRAPMNPQQTSPVPMKDEMGMDYVPVYEEGVTEEKEVVGTVKINLEKIQKIGVKTEEAKIRTLKRTIRTVGRIDHDETRVFSINTKISGWVEKLYVNRTDLMVHPGEKLLEIYSPELVATQEEYLLAVKAKEKLKNSSYDEVKKGADALVDAARQRLKYWDIADEQIDKLEKDKKIARTMTIYAPSHGIVTEKMVNEGMKIEAGEMLFKIVDHSHVWIYGEVYEYELPFIKIGQKAKIIPSYTPTDVYTAAINHIYTHFGTARHEAEDKMEESRTAKIRFELPNPEHKLKLGMYMNIEIKVAAAANAVTIPESAVIDTGAKQVVFVDKGDGRFEPREVKIGALADGYYQIISGIKAGENVVTAANFLIDSESSFRAAISGMKGH